MSVSPWSVLFTATFAIAIRLGLPLILSNAESPATMTPELQFHWHPAIVSIDRLFYRSPNFVTNFFLGIAAVWLFYRAWLVLSKPIDELIGLLGLDVPVAPTLSLAGVKADGILLHWKAPEAKHTVQKYIIKINGMEGRNPLRCRNTVPRMLNVICSW